MSLGIDVSQHAPVQVYHRFDVQEPSAYVRRTEAAADVERAVAHVQFMAQRWFGPSALVTNKGIGIALCQLYGFVQADPGEGERLDIYTTLESLRGSDLEVMSDPTLYREGLREVVEKHLEV